MAVMAVTFRWNRASATILWCISVSILNTRRSAGGTIIVRQRGTRVKPGLNVGRGKDDTLFAKITGRIKFLNKGSMGKFVMIEPEAMDAK